MLAVLDELGPTGPVTTIPGLSAVGAAVIYGSGRHVVRHQHTTCVQDTHRAVRRQLEGLVVAAVGAVAALQSPVCPQRCAAAIRALSTRSFRCRSASVP